MLALIFNGDYSRYLDDFQNSAANWHSTWSTMEFTTGIKATLLLMYEYLCLYVNAFSLQAVLTRLHTTKKSSQEKVSFGEAFPHGIMSSPDGRFVFDAVSAARTTLKIMIGLHPKNQLYYLPSRYYLSVLLFGSS